MILATNALSAFIDGDGAVGVLRRVGRAALPVIVIGEFRFGITESRYRTEYEPWLDAELPGFEVLAITAQTAASYAHLRVPLRRIGRAPMMRGSRRWRSSTRCPC